MAGPHSPNPTVGADGPPPYTNGTDQTVDYPHEPDATMPEFAPAGDATTVSTAQGSAAPAASYPKRRHRRLVIGLALALALIAAVTAAIVYGVRTNGANTGSAFSEATAKSAIQGYMDALENRDVETIVRNSLCGIYDGVKDKRSDQALARLGSDAFRKQFSEVALTSIDKIVYLSQYQAQVLFSMKVAGAGGGPLHGDLQGVAQLLYQRNQLLVCSYVLRTGGSTY
jgi:hypothetical protein